MVMNDASNLFVATVVLSKHVPNNFAQCKFKDICIKCEQKSVNIGQTISKLSIKSNQASFKRLRK